MLVNDAPIRLGIGTAWVTRFMRWIYRGVHSTSNFLVGICFGLISIPVGFTLYFVVLYFNKRLAQSLDINFTLDTKNCEKMWRRKVKLSEVVAQIKDVPAFPTERESLFVRLFLKQLLVAINSILLYHAVLEKRFQSLDTPFDVLPDNIKVVTTDQLYKGRVKGYEYLV